MFDLKKPGNTAERKGEYIEVGARGGAVAKAKQITISDASDQLPPTSKPGNKWKRIS